MFAIDEKPYTEFLRGRAVRKVSPKRRHARLQLFVGAILTSQSADAGIVGSEWRFTMPREARRTTLVPDIAFVTHERIRILDHDDREQPPFAPDLAVEIRSPGDLERNIVEKIDIYLRNGSLCVLDIDVENRSVHCYDADGSITFNEGELLISSLLPWLRIDVRALFESADLPY